MDNFETFNKTLALTVPMILRKQALDQEAKQFGQVMQQKQTELMQEAQNEKLKFAAEQIKGQVKSLQDLYNEAQKNQDKAAVEYVAPMLERLSGVSLPKTQEGGYMMFVKEDGKDSGGANSKYYNDFVSINKRPPKDLRELTDFAEGFRQQPTERLNFFVTPQGIQGLGNITGKTVTPQAPGGGPVMDVKGDIGFAASKEMAEKNAAVESKRMESYPKMRNQIESTNKQWDLVENKIKAVLKDIGPFTTGFGAYLKSIPTTKAKNLSENLETIKANIGFDKLQDMRSNSPTGGALGQVSEFENRLLQSVKGSMDQYQSSDQLRSNLTTILNDLRGMRQYTNEAFKRDWSRYAPKEQKEDPLGIR